MEGVKFLLIIQSFLAGPERTLVVRGRPSGDPFPPQNEPHLNHKEGEGEKVRKGAIHMRRHQNYSIIGISSLTLSKINTGCP